MSSLIDTFSELSEAYDSIKATYDFFALEQDDWIQGEHAARRELYQWAKDVEAALELTHKEDELRVWRNAIHDIPTLQIGTMLTSAERKFALFLQIKTRLYDEHLPKPQTEMPPSVRAVYEEAMEVFPYSSRSAAALLRLAAQKLCLEFGELGKNINDDIKSLVEKGLPVHVQHALDIVRVIGNNAVHPGLIDVQDNPEIAMRLFGLINEVVEDQISKKKNIKQLYDSLPRTAINAIEKRDAGDKPSST